jgi:hypothetical protein
MTKIFFKFLKISILWPFTFYSDPALAYCDPWSSRSFSMHRLLKIHRIYFEAALGLDAVKCSF